MEERIAIEDTVEEDMAHRRMALQPMVRLHTALLRTVEATMIVEAEADTIVVTTDAMIAVTTAIDTRRDQRTRCPTVLRPSILMDTTQRRLSTPLHSNSSTMVRTPRRRTVRLEACLELPWATALQRCLPPARAATATPRATETSSVVVRLCRHPRDDGTIPTQRPRREPTLRPSAPLVPTELLQRTEHHRRRPTLQLRQDTRPHRPVEDMRPMARATELPAPTRPQPLLQPALTLPLRVLHPLQPTRQPRRMVHRMEAQRRHSRRENTRSTAKRGSGPGSRVRQERIPEDVPA